jgi:hypothetical protein
MGGICNSFSMDESISIITSTYSVVGDLKSNSFVITSMPQNTDNFDWTPLSLYFNDHNGFKYRLYNSMVPRPDTNLLNIPPVVIVDPIITMYYGYYQWVHIPVLDANEDTILCMKFYI